jgi:prolyl oligopeptidase|tara:strand:- start:124 stop:564 length:441 start_codon:yes stop_codon:yes gene_type:complete
MYYNFWQDEKHVQGIWRKTTLESYKTKSPHWETVLDLDALEAPKTDTAGTWVWHGSTLLDEGPMNEVKDRALIKLSPGGSDADIFREFDLLKQEFIDPDEASGGFELLLPTKCRVSYRSRNELLIGTDFEQIDPSVTDSLTDSGCT